MKKNILVPFLLISLSLACKAQENETITYVNDDGKKVNESNASFLIQKQKINDTTWELNTYQINGPLLKKIQTKDENGLIKNGSYFSYGGNLGDTLGYYFNNKKIWNGISGRKPWDT